MSELISELWEGLRAAGLPEVMLYLPDSSASRCHWKDTTMIGDVRVALLADQERGIVRILPVDSCRGSGSPARRGSTRQGTRRSSSGGSPSTSAANSRSRSRSRSMSPRRRTPPPQAAPPEPAPEPPAKPDMLASRWGTAQKQSPPATLGRSGGSSFEGPDRPGPARGMDTARPGRLAGPPGPGYNGWTGRR